MQDLHDAEFKRTDWNVPTVAKRLVRFLPADIERKSILDKNHNNYRSIFAMRRQRLCFKSVRAF